jgi:cysteine desulfurase/selenocysteine lyase
MIDPKNIRADFPILKQNINAHSLVYLDSANTSLTPVQVVQKMDEYYSEYNANIHRSVYPLSERATAEYEGAREKVRRFIGAKSTKEIIFTRNATESINLVAQSWGRQHLHKGDAIVLSIMEHHSNIVPWQLLQKEKGFHIHYLSLTPDGRLNMDAYKRVIQNKNIKLVSLIHQSNVLGTVNDVKSITDLAHKRGILTLIDAAQSVPHQKVDLKKIKADFFVFTGHKMLGPTGIGVLYGREELLRNMTPFLGGGDMIRSVSIEGSTWADLPHKFEAGTPNIAGAIGLGAAIDYLENIGMKNVHDYEQKLLETALKKMGAIPEISVIGPEKVQNRGAVIAFNFAGVHAHDVATLLGEQGICVRAGNHCAQPLLDYLKVPASVRVSFYLYNTLEDIDRLIQGLQQVKKTFHV